jgi:hypothetical protein
MNSNLSGKHRKYPKPSDRVYFSTCFSLLLLRIFNIAAYKMDLQRDTKL